MVMTVGLIAIIILVSLAEKRGGNCLLVPRTGYAHVQDSTEEGFKFKSCQNYCADICTSTNLQYVITFESTSVFSLHCVTIQSVYLL